ncbi:hypothetical protein [Idiomarina piscisalsi]|uniref:hypothetical protein n=1 Tax=Idiomarina piscisalsi TaxID=1096243 RepID=UPI00137E7C71|nr:hypothetical protein [Idiomarina piscisalsi]MTJ02671.1 hypothetical protein [Idiomarina piscisalsi]
MFSSRKNINVESKPKNKWVLIVSLITLVSTVFGAFFDPVVETWSGKWEDKISLVIGDQELLKNKPNYIFFAMPRDIKKGMMFVIPMRYTLLNNSKINDKNVLLSVKYDNENLRKIIPNDAMVNNSARMSSDFEYEVVDLKNYDYSKNRLRVLGAGERFSFTEAAFSKKIANDPQTPFLTGVSIDVVATTDSDLSPLREWDVRYRGISVSNEHEMILWVKKIYSVRMATEIRKEQDFFSYLFNLLFASEIKVFAFYPQFEKISGKNIYSPSKDPEKYTAFIFAPYSWDLLFFTG